MREVCDPNQDTHVLQLTDSLVLGRWSPRPFNECLKPIQEGALDLQAALQDLASALMTL